MNKFGKYAKKASRFLLAGALVYLGLDTERFLNHLNYPRIDTQIQLEQAVERKRKKISPKNNSKINALYLPGIDEGVSYKSKQGDYEIMVGGFYARENVVSHELCHIFNGDMDKARLSSKLESKIRYFLIEEPKAILCEFIY